MDQMVIRKVRIMYDVFSVCRFVVLASAGLCRPESWPPARTRARPLWFFIR